MINYCHFGSILKKKCVTLAIDCGGLLLQGKKIQKVSICHIQGGI